MRVLLNVPWEGCVLQFSDERNRISVGMLMFHVTDASRFFWKFIEPVHL
jgi:hypothetical protein